MGDCERCGHPAAEHRIPPALGKFFCTVADPEQCTCWGYVAPEAAAPAVPRKATVQFDVPAGTDSREFSAYLFRLLTDALQIEGHEATVERVQVGRWQTTRAGGRLDTPAARERSGPLPAPVPALRLVGPVKLVPGMQVLVEDMDHNERVMTIRSKPSSYGDSFTGIEVTFDAL